MDSHSSHEVTSHHSIHKATNHPFGPLQQKTSPSPNLLPPIFPPIMPTAVISALIKAGNLSHKTLPQFTRASSIESMCCIPQQAVDAALSTPTLKNGRFLIFYRCTTIIIDDPSMRTPDASFRQRCDVCQGWEFELTQEGTVKYNGLYRGLEIDTEQEWTTGRAEIKNLVSPHGAISPKKKQPRQTTEENQDIPAKISRKEYPNKDSDLHESYDLTYRFALYGCGDHVSVVSTIRDATGQGTWKRLLNEPRKSYRSTHVLYISLPELIGHMIACGVAAGDVTRSLQQGEWGSVKLNFHAMEWRGPESIRSGRDAKPKDKWKEGWWYTWRPGMEVWVC